MFGGFACGFQAVLDIGKPAAELSVGAPQCLLCAGASAELICAGCREDLPWNRLACPRCARPLAAGPARVCPACLEREPAFEHALAAFRYETPVDQAVQRLKYGADFLAARWLGEALAQAAAARPSPLPQVLVPVPLHARRLRSRGYNQALELARALARRLDVEVRPQLAQRLRATEDQIGKSAVERRRNVKNAFAVDPAVRGLHLALLDDVMTTGSTLDELARTCRKAGAARVEAWVVARAV